METQHVLTAVVYLVVHNCVLHPYYYITTVLRRRLICTGLLLELSRTAEGSLEEVTDADDLNISTET